MTLHVALLCLQVLTLGAGGIPPPLLGVSARSPPPRFILRSHAFGVSLEYAADTPDGGSLESFSLGQRIDFLLWRDMEMQRKSWM